METPVQLSAFQRAFHIFEIARLVLNSLSGRELLKTQQVCRILSTQVRALKIEFTKANGTTIQVAVGGDKRPRVNPFLNIVCEPLEPVTRISENQPLSMHKLAQSIYADPANVTLQPWYNMYLTMPPITTASLLAQKPKMQVNHSSFDELRLGMPMILERIRDPSLVIKLQDPQGVTIGQVVQKVILQSTGRALPFGIMLSDEEISQKARMIFQFTAGKEAVHENPALGESLQDLNRRLSRVAAVVRNVGNGTQGGMQ